MVRPHFNSLKGFLGCFLCFGLFDRVLGFWVLAIEAEVNFSFWFEVLGLRFRVTMGVNEWYLTEGSESI